MCGVDAASQKSPSKESSVYSRPRPESQAITGRLKIFETFAKSTDQRDDYVQSSPEVVKPDQDCFGLDDQKSVNELLQHSLVELREMIDATKTHVISTESIESLIVFQSLLQMLSMPEQVVSDSPSPWQNYLSDSIKNLKCSVMDLCREFPSHFKCDKEGHLNLIVLDRKGPFRHLNLLMIPNTVEKLSMERCGLASISAWSDLKGKSLKSLRIYEPRILNLNLDGLQWALDYLPLEHLSVGRPQISVYFGVQKFDSSDPAFRSIGRWTRLSTLEVLRIQTNSGGRHHFAFYRDGTWTHYRGSR